MTNVNSPYGFEPITPNARVRGYTIASGYGTAINFGDPVAGSGTGTGPLPGIVIGVAGSDTIGVFQGVSYTDSNGQPQWAKSWPASTVATNVVALVSDDPFTTYRAQITTEAVTDYFNKVGYVVAAGTSGISGSYLDGATIGTGTDFQIQGLFDVVGNGTGAFAQVTGVFRLSSMNYPYTAL